MNSAMAQVLPATIATPPDSPVEQRSDARRRLSLQVSGSLVDGREFNATVSDLSRVGFLMNSATTMTVGEMIYVELPRLGRASARVAWVEGRLAGCRLVEPISSAAVSAALLRALPDRVPLLAGGSPVELDRESVAELSSRQKLAVLLGLSLLGWAIVLEVGYAVIHLLGA